MLGRMTIASHCLDLLSLRSPRSLEELTEAAVVAGLTRSQNPQASVSNALYSHKLEAPLLPDGRYGYTLHILENCWITTRQRNGDRLPPSFDIDGLANQLRRRTLPLPGGGQVGSTRHADGLRGPAGWLPKPRDGTVIGLRITAGALEVRAVELDDEAAARGRDLAARLRARIAPPSWPRRTVGREDAAWQALVQLLAEEPDVLASPVAPLSELLPELAPSPEARIELADPVTIALPLQLRKRLQQRADDNGMPVSDWLTDRLEELASTGHLPIPGVAYDGWDDRGGGYTRLYWGDEDGDLDSRRNLSAG